MKQPIEEKQIDSDIMENELRDEPEADQDSIHNSNPQPPAINMLKGSEDVSIEYNGCKIALSSSKIDAAILSEIAYNLFHLLKSDGSDGNNNGGSYLG